MKKKKETHLYCIKKYVVATSAKDAIKKDKDSDVDDVWIEQRDYSANKEVGFNSK